MNKTVPTLLTTKMVDAIDALNKTRADVGIPAENKYLFPNRGKGPLQIWKILQTVASEASCNNPELISSSRLRKYIATVAQVMLSQFDINPFLSSTCIKELLYENMYEL